MSPRGAKRDLAVTKLLLDNGLLLDKRSFVSHEPHLYLKGDDIVKQRARVAGRSGGLCGICKKPFGGIFGYDWEMDHIQGGLTGRYDDLSNLQAVHAECHRKRHVHIKSAKEST